MIRLGDAARLHLFVASLVLVLQLFSLPVLGQKAASYPRVTRGAYLQSGSPTSMVVRWRTGQATTGAVRYGLEPDKLDFVATSAGKSKDHVVLLSALTPATRYYYSLGTTNRVLQRGPQNHFRTSPDAGATNSIRVWVLGDPGTGYPVQKSVRDAYQRVTGSTVTDLILTLGDNAYRSGTDAQYDRAFFDVYRQIFKHTVLWPAIGNHDARSADAATESGVYFDIFTLPRLGQAGGVTSGTEAYYSFNYGHTHFICLNSHDGDLSTNSVMLAWLRRDLAENRTHWNICYWHHAPYSKGSHDSDSSKEDDRRMTEMREKVVPLLEAEGVDLVLCGHSHLYERSYPLQGHYGKSDSLESHMIRDRGDGRVDGSGPYRLVRTPGGNSGTVYVNAGSAGQVTRIKDVHGLNHPAIAVGLNVPGSLVLDISLSRLDATFLDDKGVRRDWFTLTQEQ